MYIKGFDKNLCCRGFQFEIGKTYDSGVKDADVIICEDGAFHFCKSLQTVDEYYSVNEDNRYCEIEVLGVLVEDDYICCSNKIKIVREIKGDELNELLGKTNGNTGYWNTGCWNSGDLNSGNYNSGYWNSGNDNSGNNNSGNFNSGIYNSGNDNSGNNNSGNKNSGYRNSGNNNSGNYNSGNKNSGYYNSGNFNSGYYNSGNLNSGAFNNSDGNTGFFNTIDHTVKIFNLDSGMTQQEFYNSKYWNALISGEFTLTDWIDYSEEDKAKDKEKALIGGYLKTYTYEEACANWWNSLQEEDKQTIMSIPNFNADIFKEITGINVNKEAPLKPITRLKEGVLAVPNCAKCKGLVLEEYNYCPRCGQKLDWSKE